MTTATPSTPSTGPDAPWTHPDGAGDRDDAGYADLATYAALGDGRTIALLARDGRIDWFPLPTLVSASPFAAILDAEEGGFLALAPRDVGAVSRTYEPGTNVVATVFTTGTGSVRVTDSLNTGIAGRLPWTELGRRVEGLDGEVEMVFTARPGTCLGAVSPWIQDTAHGPVIRVDGLTVAVVGSDGTGLTWDADEVTARFSTSPGSRHTFGLVGTEREPVFVPAPDTIDAGIDRTVATWQGWSEVFDSEARWSSQVLRSALALKLLIHAPSGAIAAAATTSLPESGQGGKNWDYRFAWVRDMAYSVTALQRFGLREETHAAISWLVSTIREHGPEPEIFYGLDGSPPASDSGQSQAPGWRGIGPVLWGNDAADQLQLGVFGDLFSIVALYVDDGNILDAQTGRMLAEVADLTCDRWRSADAGMWELETTQHYTSSKMGCWQALTQAVHLAELGQIPGDPSRWRTEAERIRDWIDEHAWSEEVGAYTWYPGTEQLDASVLLHAISGFDRGERMSRTLDALAAELGDGPHLYRYSGVDAEEATFVACSFWMVSALALTGRVEEARDRFEALLATVPNDVGVMAEMHDPSTGAAVGNLPQALSHLALINAALTLGDRLDDAEGSDASDSDPDTGVSASG